MTPEQIKHYRHQATEAHAMDRDAMNELIDEVERLQRAFNAAHTCTIEECDTGCAYL